MEISEVKKRVLGTIDRAKRQAADRRTRADAASGAYDSFLRDVAVPIFKQVANVLRAEGLLFSVFTPGGGVRLVSERRSEDYVEITLDTAGEQPFVKGHSSRGRGGRIVEAEEAVGAPDLLTEDDVLAFVLRSIEPFVER
jgi:hypothetical protein